MTQQCEHSSTQQVEELRAAVDKFQRFIRDLPVADLAEKAWGPKEVLAHLVFWIESYVIQIEALLSGERPEPPRGRFDDLNAQVVTASRGTSITGLLGRHRRACERLCAIALERDPASLEFCLKQGSSKPQPLSWFLAGEASHIRHHHRRLLQQARRDPAHDTAKLADAVAGFCGFIRGLPEADITEQAWGPKEVLAHVVFWHTRYVAQIEALLAARPFEPPRAKRDDWNARAANASRGVPISELLRRFEAVDERLRDYGQTLDPQNMVLEFPWKRGVWLCTLDEVIFRTETHIRDHQRALARER